MALQSLIIVCCDLSVCRPPWCGCFVSYTEEQQCSSWKVRVCVCVCVCVCVYLQRKPGLFVTLCWSPLCLFQSDVGALYIDNLTSSLMIHGHVCVSLCRSIPPESLKEIVELLEGDITIRSVHDIKATDMGQKTVIVYITILSWGSMQLFWPQYWNAVAEDILVGLRIEGIKLLCLQLQCGPATEQDTADASTIRLYVFAVSPSMPVLQWSTCTSFSSGKCTLFSFSPIPLASSPPGVRFTIPCVCIASYSGFPTPPFFFCSGEIKKLNTSIFYTPLWRRKVGKPWY